MSQHPLLDLSADREVRQAKGFRKVAAGLTGAGLAAHYKQELAAAPRRHEAGKKYLGNHPAKPPGERKSNRDEEHIGQALLRYFAEVDHPFRLPRDAGEIQLVDYAVPLQSASPDRSKGDADPNKGVGKADLLAVGPDQLLTVAKLRFLEPSATRGGTGDTPLRQLLEGLAFTAIVEANRAEIQQELAERGGPELSQDPPLLVLMASPRYWQLCRRREAQKGAAWIRELERLMREFGEESGVQVIFAGLALEGDPGWEYDEQGPVLTGIPRLEPAWERHAGRVRPRAASRPKAQAQADEIVEADLSRPVRDYKVTESYEPGDRIQHPTLGLGVVQEVAGPGKISVRFDERKSLLIHERG